MDETRWDFHFGTICFVTGRYTAGRRIVTALAACLFVDNGFVAFGLINNDDITLNTGSRFKDNGVDH